MRNRCWLAIVLAPEGTGPLNVEVLDGKGNAQLLETGYGARHALPAYGAFCSLLESFQELRIRVSSLDEQRLQIIWYAMADTRT